MSRYIYECEHGVISNGLFVMHKCDNPNCINPKHLSIGTPKQNSIDMVFKNRQARGMKNGGGVKLNDQKVRSIRKDNRTLQEIADHYGVSKKLILNVKKHRNWRHII
ncbi:HNH endonuclease [Paenibacillus sp. FSL R7-269]|uniref:HNH endonuclease n=1 Tax=Paenibacillus sp. FSL R7-269 TaxID=1226755 RepID=UPI00138DFD8B|nr:HNH endonuclease [Paenibacillus sp. FSL R7-269]